MEFQALTRELREKLRVIAGNGKISAESVQTINGKDDVGEMADHIAFNLDFRLEDKQGLLEATRLTTRIRTLLTLLDTEQEVQAVQAKIRAQVEGRDRQEPARVLPARADESDPEGTSGR